MCPIHPTGILKTRWETAWAGISCAERMHLDLRYLPCMRVDNERRGVDGSWQSHGAAHGPDEQNRDDDNQLACLRGQGGHDGPPPVQGDGQHGEHAGRDRGERDELVEGAVEGSKVPNSMTIIKHNTRVTDAPVPHVDEGEDAVKGGYEDVCHAQVQQKVVGHAPHATVGWKKG